MGKRLLYTVRGVRVYLVNGELIRDRIDVDFVAGGNHGRWKWIPHGEVWIERILSPHDREATIRHELAERAMMLRGRSYGAAHDAANVIERRFRRSHVH